MGMGAGMKGMMSKLPSMPGPTAPWENKKLLDPATCKSKKTDVMCSLRDGIIKYERPEKRTKWLQEKKRIMMQFGGGDDQNIMHGGFGQVTKMAQNAARAAGVSEANIAKGQQVAKEAGINTKEAEKALEKGMDTAKKKAQELGLPNSVDGIKEAAKKKAQELGLPNSADGMADMASKVDGMDPAQLKGMAGQGMGALGGMVSQGMGALKIFKL